MLMDNGINTILDFLCISFKNIEDIEVRVDKKHIKLSLANTNRLKVLTSFHIYNAQRVTNATSRGTRRSVYNSTIYYESTENDICESHNIDSSIFS